MVFAQAVDRSIASMSSLMVGCEQVPTTHICLLLYTNEEDFLLDTWIALLYTYNQLISLFWLDVRLLLLSCVLGVFGKKM